MIVTFPLSDVKRIAALAGKQARLREGYASGVLCSLSALGRGTPRLYLQGGALDPRSGENLLMAGAIAGVLEEGDSDSFAEWVGRGIEFLPVDYLEAAILECDRAGIDVLRLEFANAELCQRLSPKAKSKTRAKKAKKATRAKKAKS